MLSGKAQAQVSLTGAIAFSADSAGNISANEVWNTLGGDERWNLWPTYPGTSGGFISGPTDGQAGISMPLYDGTYTLGLYAEPNFDVQNIGLNLFFNGSTPPSISVFAAINMPSAPQVPPFYSNGGTTYQLNGLDRTLGSGSLSFAAGSSTVTLTGFRWSHPDVENVNRVGIYSTGSDRRTDFVGEVTLNVTGAPPPPPSQINYPDFSSAAGLRLLGNAGTASNALRVTPAGANVRGAAWFAAPQQVDAGFVTTFQFRINDPGGRTDCDGNTGADGLAFVIQNQGSNVLPPGLGGGDIGYHGISNSLAVEFDTFNNREWGNGDPSGNHISVQTSGTLPNSWDHKYSLGATSAIPNLSDGNVHTVRISYWPGRMDVYIDNIASPVLSADVWLNQLGIVDTLGPIMPRAWTGFTAATGAAWENHDVLNWKFKPLPERAAELACQLAVAPDEAAKVPYLWEAKGFDNSSGQFLPPYEVRGLDCSGLFAWAYNRAYYEDTSVVLPAPKDGYLGGKSCPVVYAKSTYQWLYNTTPIPEGLIKPGDMLFFDFPDDLPFDHVAMYVGDGMVVQAEKGKYDKVVELSWDEIMHDIGKYYVGTGRLDVARDMSGSIIIQGRCPIDLIVTDPDGLCVGKDIRGIPWAYYLKEDSDGDGELEDLIIIRDAKIGNYNIQIVPDGSALPEDIFSLSVVVGDSTVMTLDNVMVGEISGFGYDFYSPTPEPATLTLLAIGGLFVAGRRFRRPSAR
jgi:hypothetical protein